MMNIAEEIIRISKEKKLTFGFAESATGGLLSHLITQVSGASQVFMGSIVSYDSLVKVKLLNVSSQTITTYNVVSDEVAKEMAQGLREKIGVDVAISVTGIAGPTGGTPTIPVGTVSIGLSTKSELYAQTFHYAGSREELKNQFAQKALFTLLDELRKVS